MTVGYRFLREANILSPEGNKIMSAVSPMYVRRPTFCEKVKDC